MLNRRYTKGERQTMKNKIVTRTKRPMQHYAFRLKREDRRLLRQAAIRMDQSMGEFLRAALRERATNVLGEKLRTIA
jgi:uncharacterized protein (DUF1778 family)